MFEAKKIQLTENGKQRLMNRLGRRYPRIAKQFKEATQLYMIGEPDSQGYVAISPKTTGTVFTCVHMDDVLLME